MKRRVHISVCTDMDVLAEDILNSGGVLMLPCGTSINQYIIQKLADLGIEYVWVTSDTEQLTYTNSLNFEKKYEKNIEALKHLVLDMIRGKKIDHTVMSNITDSVISSLEEPEHVIACLGKIRETDDYTYYHCVNVSFYSMLIAGWLNLSRDDIRTVLQAGLLHDVGKAKIPNELLNKKEKLSEQEFDLIKRHTIYGYEMVKNDPKICRYIKDVILMHHEREDRSGYPLQADGEELGLHTKIVAVADVYDAMTSQRPYKKALTPFEAFEEFMTVCRGRMDMHIVNTLLYNLSRYYTGSRVLLSNGQTGNIAYIPPHCIWKPIVDTELGFLDLSREKEVFVTSMA